jgi:hypothetical protein
MARAKRVFLRPGCPSVNFTEDPVGVMIQMPLRFIRRTPVSWRCSTLQRLMFARRAASAPLLPLTIPESGRRPSVSAWQLNQFFARYHDFRSRDKSGYLWMIADMQLRISVVLVGRT